MPTVEAEKRMPGSNGSQGGEGFHCFRGDRSTEYQTGCLASVRKPAPPSTTNLRAVSILAAGDVHCDSAISSRVVWLMLLSEIC